VARLGVSWRGGFHHLETTPEGSYRWGDAEAEMLVVNASTAAVRVRLGGAADAVGRRRSTLWMEAAGERAGHRVGRDRAPVAMSLTLPPGGTVVRFHTDAPRVVAEGDPRHLHFRLWEPRLEAEAVHLVAAGG